MKRSYAQLGNHPLLRAQFSTGFMTNYKATVFVRILGRDRARFFYALLGLFLMALGLAGAFGLLPPR